MDLTSLLTRGKYRGNGDDTMTNNSSGNTQAMDNYQIFINDVMSNPKAVYDTLFGQAPYQPVAPVTPGPSMPSVLTDEVAPQQMGGSQIDAIKRALEERERIKREI